MEKKVYNSKDVMVILGCSRSTAYSIIQKLNKEWVDSGKLALAGKVSAEYFNKRYLDCN